MVAALGDFEALIRARSGDAIDQPMFAIDAAGPPARPFVAERLGLADALERRSSSFRSLAWQWK